METELLTGGNAPSCSMWIGGGTQSTNRGMANKLGKKVRRDCEEVNLHVFLVICVLNFTTETLHFLFSNCINTEKYHLNLGWKLLSKCCATQWIPWIEKDTKCWILLNLGNIETLHVISEGRISILNNNLVTSQKCSQYHTDVSELLKVLALSAAIRTHRRAKGNCRAVQETFS